MLNSWRALNPFVFFWLLGASAFARILTSSFASLPHGVYLIDLPNVECEPRLPHCLFAYVNGWAEKWLSGLHRFVLDPSAFYPTAVCCVCRTNNSNTLCAAASAVASGMLFAVWWYLNPAPEPPSFHSPDNRPDAMHFMSWCCWRRRQFLGGLLLKLLLSTEIKGEKLREFNCKCIESIKLNNQLRNHHYI